MIKIRRVHWIARGVFLIAFSAFVVALIWEKWGGEAPCAFCLMERIVVLVGALGAGFAFLSREPIAQRLLLGSVFLWALGLVISFQHLGVQNHWFPVPSFCKIPEPQGASLEEIAQELLAAPIVRCDRITKTFLGQPPATYLCLLMAGMMVACFLGAQQATLQEEIDRQKKIAEDLCQGEREQIHKKEIQLQAEAKKFLSQKRPES